MNLNLGCGELQQPNSFNVDIRRTSITDEVLDLTQYPWPFDDEQFDNIFAIDIIEHILYVIPFMDECWRVVKPSGIMQARVPWWKSEQSYRDITHLHYFTMESFDYFDPWTEVGKQYPYSEKKWRILDRRLDVNEIMFNLQKVPTKP
jgi:predicted SAM-dependent methyltransferase